jgi:hypothetical protein
MAPHGVGDTRLVSDDKADELQRAGDLSASETWPVTASAPVMAKPVRPALKINRPVGVPDSRLAR